MTEYFQLIIGVIAGAFLMSLLYNYQVKKLERDAKRYRYLRAQHISKTTTSDIRVELPADMQNGIDLDQAIDIALKNEIKQESNQ